jgi:hypothetical protein
MNVIFICSVLKYLNLFIIFVHESKPVIAIIGLMNCELYMRLGEPKSFCGHDDEWRNICYSWKINSSIPVHSWSLYRMKGSIVN